MILESSNSAGAQGHFEIIEPPAESIRRRIGVFRARTPRMRVFRRIGVEEVLRSHHEVDATLDCVSHVRVHQHPRLGLYGPADPV